MRAAVTGCLIIFVATIVMVVVWWVLATYVFSTGDDGPSHGHAWMDDPYETAEFACPYDGTPLVAPWQKCPKCGRND